MGFWKLCVHLWDHQTILCRTLLPDRVRCPLWQHCTQGRNYASEQSHLASRVAQWVILSTCLNFCKILPRRGRVRWNAHRHPCTFSGYMQEQPPATMGGVVRVVSWFSSQCNRKRVGFLSDVMVIVTSAECLLKERRMSFVSYKSKTMPFLYKIVSYHRRWCAVKKGLLSS